MSLIDKLIEKKLTYKERQSLPDSAFIFPKERKYPIQDISHARNALARISAHGTPAEQAKVKAEVSRRYPQIGGGQKLKLAAHKDVSMETRQELREWINKNIDLPEEDVEEQRSVQMAISKAARHKKLIKALGKRGYAVGKRGIARVMA